MIQAILPVLTFAIKRDHCFGIVVCSDWKVLCKLVRKVFMIAASPWRDTMEL
jgi:hypothetical protein